MQFSTLSLKKLIITTLREFFASEAVPEHLRYSGEEDSSKIEISSLNDFNKVVLQAKPRIMFDRGSYSVSSSGLNDALYESKGYMQDKGATNRVNTNMVVGNSSLVVDCRNEGTCEAVTNIVSHFLLWSRPFISNALGLKGFCNPLSVSPCSPMREETEIFRCVISYQYTVDEYWHNARSAVILKDIFQKVEQGTL